MSGLLLGVDMGTSRSKGVLAQPDGEIIATSERPHELSLPRPGWAEHDAEHVWWADFKAICADLLPRVDGALAAVCVSGIGPCLLAANEAGQPQETIGASYGDALLAAIAVGLVNRHLQC